MPLKLVDPKQLPAGGFWYAQNGRTFNEMVSFEGKKKLILVFRQDNGLERATAAQVDEDLQNETCNRHPEICYDPGNLASAASKGYGTQTVGGCHSCGGQRA